MEKKSEVKEKSLYPDELAKTLVRKKVLLIIFIIFIPFLLILLSYKANINIAEYSPMQKEVIDFLQYKNGLNANMDPSEFSHLVDVKKIMKTIDFVFYSLVSVCALILTYNYKDGTKLKKPLFYGGVASLGLIAPLFIFTLIDFNSAFTIFHQIFFPKGNWIFSQNSFLIKTFPLSFFISMAKKIILTALSFAVAFILISVSLKPKDGRI